ncbi:HYR domain-containing protein [Psychroflexus sediminis]|uniref:Por secretion system C-terminal sorting domain-containing protein n=1 Tax=Psychroflexus sediminis TaxID=470826 RepID=A0A1G7XCI6_9FLAO|nr:HYR domain-containing protein [Psychroflexus sediminis]SDG81958.1 Por secretion system C-terminal sorting domain-containing protein [Psychroflexus sediminis]
MKQIYSLLILFIVSLSYGQVINPGTTSANIVSNSAPNITCPEEITTTATSPIVNFNNPTLTDNETTAFPFVSSDMTYIGSNGGKNFFISEQSFSGANAFADAIARGGLVATISDATQNTFIANALQANNITEAHIGYSDAASEGNFVWQDGSTSGYENWQPNEPNDTDGGEDYVTISAGGGWNDVGARGTGNARYIFQLDQTDGFLIQTSGLASGSSFPIGTTTNTFEAYDASGNSSICSFNVTVTDIPEVVTQNIDVVLDATGNATISPEEIDNGSTAVSGILGLSLDILNFDCSNLGENTVTLTVISNTVETATGTAIVTVRDTTAPTVVTQDITVELDASGEAIITADQIDNGSADNCGIASLDLSRTNFNGFDIGQNTVELKVTDSSGNQSAGTATVTIVDTTPPNAVCSNQTIFLDESGNASISASDVDGGSSDNASAAYIPLLNYEPIETGSGINASEFEFVAQVVTIPQPISDFRIKLELATCKSNGLTGATLDIVELDPSGHPDLSLVLGSSSVPESDIYGWPGCVSGSFGLTTFDFSGVDLQQGNQYALVLKNSEGARGSVSWNRSAIPTDPSNPYQGGNIWTYENYRSRLLSDEVWREDETHDLHFSIEALQEDLTYSIDQDSFDCSNLGVNTVSLTVTDASGNTSSCISEVTVIDNLAPTVVTQDITVELDANGEAGITADQIDNGTSDNCSSISGYCIEGMTYGNAEIFIEGAGMGRVDFSAGLVSASSGGVPMELVPITTIDSKVRSGDLVHARSTLSTGSRPSGESIFYRVSDGRIIWGGHSPSGSFANRTQLVIEQPNVATGELIDFSKPYNLKFQLNGRYLSQSGGSFTSVSSPADISAVLISGDLGATNNCLLTTSLDATTFDCSNLGDNEVTLTVTDGSGNSSSATAIVTVIDNIAPTIVLKDVTVELNAEGTVSVEASAFDNGSFDNCGEVTFSTNLVEILSCGALGLNEVTVTVTDASGNQSQNTAILTVLDNLSPAVVTQDFTVVLNANGEATITAAQVDNGSADNCGVDTLALDITTFDCSNLGENTVTLTATDGSGKQATATAIVTVVDNSLPTAVAQNLTVELDEFGAASITAAQVDNGSSDNCGVETLALDVTSFDCSNLGENTVTLRVTDGSGNQATSTAVITVIDALAPALVTADITVSLDENATVSIEPGNLVDTLEDNCSLAGEITLALDQDTFTATGIYVVNITATDASGNTTTESAEVTVDSTLSIDQVDSDIQVKLYPNPTTDHLFFEVSNTELIHITIYDMNGKLVKTSQESHSVDVTNLSSGVYFAKVDAKGGNTLKILRFIKK